jgi:outer membrane murein-binding lipoprotein Lpp
MKISNVRLMRLAVLLGVLAIAGCASEGAKPEKTSTKPTSATTTKPTSATTAPAAATKPAPTATAPAAASTNTAPGKDQGTVVFFRESKFAGSAISYKVRENQVELGKLSSGNYFIVNLPKGPHQFEVHSEAKDVLHMEVEPGQTYYFLGTLSMGFMAGHPHLEPSTAAVFESMKPKLKNSALVEQKKK